jgi:large subunit ribosomal protein L22
MMENAIAKAEYKNARISPKKVAPVMDLVRGKGVEEAKIVLSFDPTKAAKMVLKMLKSAEANAVSQNHSADSLFVSEIWVGPARMIKTGKAGSRGRYDPILKRSSHMYVYLGERLEK